MLNRLVIASCFLGLAVPALFGQARSTATRSADLQVGAGFVYDNASYPPSATFKGFAAYTTLDLTSHLGGEFVIHQAKSSDGLNLYERTYEIGPRYFRHYGRFAPYVKAMYGRGVYNFTNGGANLAYNLFAFGLGTDVQILPYINLRVDYEYQKWLSFQPSTLTPQVITIGVAYHFPGGLKQGKHF